MIKYEKFPGAIFTGTLEIKCDSGECSKEIKTGEEVFCRPCYDSLQEQLRLKEEELEQIQKSFSALEERYGYTILELEDLKKHNQH